MLCVRIMAASAFTGWVAVQDQGPGLALAAGLALAELARVEADLEPGSMAAEVFRSWRPHFESLNVGDAKPLAQLGQIG